jgi:uncharacterized protein YggE
VASITVAGQAIASVTPDRATLDLGLTHVGLTASAAMDAVAARSNALERLLGELGFGPADWSTQGISLGEEWQWKNEENVLVGHRATTGITVMITAFERISTLLQRAVDGTGAQIRNLQWQVSAHHPARRALLGAAATDAAARADAYAEALGMQRGGVEEVSDQPIAGPPEPRPLAAAMRLKTADSGPPLSVNAGEIELHETVFIRFTILPR